LRALGYQTKANMVTPGGQSHNVNIVAAMCAL